MGDYVNIGGAQVSGSVFLIVAILVVSYLIVFELVSAKVAPAGKRRQRGATVFPEEYATAEWRTGRSVGRTIYAMRGGIPSDTDPLIGMMDTAQLARVVVEAHNELLGRSDGKSSSS